MSNRRTAPQWVELLLQRTHEARDKELGDLALVDPDLAAEVRQLLPSEDHTDATRRPTSVETPSVVHRDMNIQWNKGDRVGPYVILELLGDGGFGSVYKAEQRTPVQRTVALKVIKAGVDTKEVIARFSSERQALARMDHPHIAKVLDAGSTDAGRPYFVMEHVPGLPITEFADEQKLTIDERLELFKQVCDAINHAHQKAIIHRDIKAGNVLAYRHDGKPTVKVIDFGIAKAMTSDRLTDLTFNTAGGMVIGTYTTMSPEQAAGSPDIDTRTDVYSLGMLLYELLTGVAPFDPRELARSADDEVRRIIREVDPPSPSTRLTRIDPTETESLAKTRRIRLEELGRTLRHELEWIPLMALRKEPARRYASPLQLAEDIDNYLNGRPLIAGPESRAYRTKKLIAKHRVALATAAVIAVLLAGGIVGTTTQMVRADEQAELALAEAERANDAEADALRQRDEAEQQRLVAEQQRQEAERQAAIAEETNDFLVGMFDEANPANARGDEITVIEVVERAVDDLGDRFENRPLVKAVLQTSLGEVLFRVGRYPQATTLFEETLDTHRRQLGNDHRQTLDTMNNLGVVYFARGDFEKAAPLIQEALDGRRRVLGNEHPDTLASVGNLAALLFSNEDFRAAEPLLRESLDGHQRELGDDHPDTLTSIRNLATVLGELGDVDAAVTLSQQAVDGYRRVLGGDHPETLMSITNLATQFINSGDLEAAERLYREAHDGSRRVLGGDHPDTLSAANGLAVVLQVRGDKDAAETLYRDTLERQRRVLGDIHPDTLLSLQNTAFLLADRGEYDAAEPLYREAIEGYRRVFGNEHPATRKAARRHADCLAAMGRTEEAEAVRVEFRLKPPASQPASDASE
ncbi:MAG: tetratricopeptide repeat protein [Planctomycetota bacterium]